MYAFVFAGFHGNSELLEFRVEHQLLDRGKVDFVEKSMSDGQVRMYAISTFYFFSTTVFEVVVCASQVDLRKKYHGFQLPLLGLLLLLLDSP